MGLFTVFNTGLIYCRQWCYTFSKGIKKELHCLPLRLLQYFQKEINKGVIYYGTCNNDRDVQKGL